MALPLPLAIAAHVHAPAAAHVPALAARPPHRLGAPVCLLPHALLPDGDGVSAHRCCDAQPARPARASAGLPARGWVEGMRQGVTALLAVGLMMGGNPQLAFAENELQALAGGQFKSELVQPECFATSCKQQTKACAENGDCTKGLACTAKCMGDAQCTVGCFAKYGNKDLDNILQCTIEDAGCIKIATQAPGADLPWEAPPPPKALVKATPATMSGKWYKVLGWNPNYDCFDCQRNTFDSKLASNDARAGLPVGREVAIDIGATGVDVEVEYAMPRERLGQPSEVFRSTLHETLQFDNAPGSTRTAHTEGKMFGLTFWENWYVIGQNKVNEPQFRFVYYTGKTLQNRYEGAFVYARTPELPRDAMPSIYKIAREAGMDPTGFCCVDNKCFSGPSEATAKPPPFTPVAEAAMGTSTAAKPTLQSPVDLLPGSLKQIAVDAIEYLEDPKPFGTDMFSKQRKMSEVLEYDENGYRVPVQRRR